MRCVLFASLSIIVSILRHDASASVIDYHAKQLPYGYLDFHRTGMYSRSTAPAIGSPGNGQSYVRFDLVFTRFDDHSDSYDAYIPTSVEVLVLTQEDFNRLGYERTVQTQFGPSKQRIFCCDEEAQAAGECFELNTLITAEGPTPPIFRKEIEMLPTKLGHLAMKLDIPNEDLYVTVFGSCNAQTGLTQMDGTVTWLNPYGYLPGEQYAYMPFFEYLVAIALITAVVWFIMCAYHWREILAVQIGISFLILLFMLETSFHYMYYLQLNKHGTSKVGLLIAGVTFNTLKRTFMRTLILSTSMGIGVTRQTLGPSQYKIFVLSAFYFIFAEAQYLVENLTTAPTPILPEYFLMVPLVALDMGFATWIFRELIRTIVRLKERRQTRKIRVFRRLQVALAVAVGFGTLIPFVHVWAIHTGWLVTHWQLGWIFRSSWHVVYEIVLLTIMYLWRPRTRARERIEMEEVSVVEEGKRPKELEMTQAGSKVAPEDTTLEIVEKQLYEGLGLAEEDGNVLGEESGSAAAHKVE